jgi:hypothetical protein
MLLGLCLASAGLAAGKPDTWVPARWDGGPLEVAHRAKDKSLADAAVRDAVAGWYEPATLGLLEGTPVNCLLLTFSAGAAPELEKQQQQLVKEYARKAHERGIVALGLVYPGADASAVAAAATDAGLDGLVLEGEFPGGAQFAEELDRKLRSANNAAVVIPIGTAGVQRKAAWPVLAVEGVSPGVGKADSGAVASASGGTWVDSNMWLVRSFHLDATPRPLWISQRPAAGAPSGIYTKSVGDAAAAGARWIVTLDDALRAKLLHQDADAQAVWRNIGNVLSFYEKHADWRAFEPFGNIGMILDTAGPNLANSEEYLNLVARHQISYRVIDRSKLGAAEIEGLRGVLAFDLAPATDAERKTLEKYANDGGLVLIGPSWGGAPKDQAYRIAAMDKGEVAVFKEATPDPESIPRDINDMLVTEELGVNLFNAPSVLSYVSTDKSGDHMLIQLVNYADTPSGAITVWVADQFDSAHLYIPDGAAVDLPVKHTPSRTEISIPKITGCGALLLE